MANDVTIEIDFDDNTVIIIPEGGKTYAYNTWEISNDLVDRLITGDADYTVYSQGEQYTEDQLSREEIASAIRENEEPQEVQYKRGR